jgi:hypothetical protein
MHDSDEQFRPIHDFSNSSISAGTQTNKSLNKFADNIKKPLDSETGEGVLGSAICVGTEIDTKATWAGVYLFERNWLRHFANTIVTVIFYILATYICFHFFGNCALLSKFGLFLKVVVYSVVLGLVFHIIFILICLTKIKIDV